jgi:ABC-type phosphate transport system substrate-binding protein
LSQAGDPKDIIVIFTHKAGAAEILSRDELRPIFQTRINSWPDGTPATPFNLPSADPLRRGFDAAVLGLDPDSVVRYWIDRKIRGGPRPPQIAPTGSAMIKIVSKTPGAIGYADGTAALDANVKVVARVLGGQVVNP